MSTPENRFAPPSTEVADPATPAREPTPKTVIQAVWLLWASLLLGIPAAIIYASGAPFDAEAIAGLVVQLFVFAFMALVIVRISTGKNWARMAALALTLLGVLSMFALPEETTVIEYLLGALSSTLDAIAMYLLFLSPGRVWFRPIAGNEA
jgi:hypothetical protein